MTEFGTGWITAQGDSVQQRLPHQPGAPTTACGSTRSSTRLPEAGAPDAVPATAGIVSTLLAWQQYGGSSGQPEIRVRYAPDGTQLDPSMVVSSPNLGAANADLGLFAGGDLAGDAAIAWVQSNGGQNQIVTAQLFQAPKAFAPSTAFAYADQRNPLLAWSAPSELWGPLTYTVKLDGVAIGSSQSRLCDPADAGGPGPSCRAGRRRQPRRADQQRPAPRWCSWIRCPPQVRPRITGARHVGDVLHIYVRDTDQPPGLPASAGSGVVSLQVKWGDGARRSSRHAASHVYRRRGRYTVTVIAFDRAGNRTDRHQEGHDHGQAQAQEGQGARHDIRARHGRHAMTRPGA